MSWRIVLLLVPLLQLRYLRRSIGDPLVHLRTVYASYFLYLILAGAVLPSLLPFGGDRASVYWTLGIGVLALAYYFIVPHIERPLRCESDRVLAAFYRTRMFLRIAFATSTALFGFTAAFICDAAWVYYAGFLFSLPALLRAAPTSSALLRDQDELTARGCDRSLVAALRQAPPG